MKEVLLENIAIQGVWPSESDGFHTFSWTEKQFSLSVPKEVKTIAFEAYTPLKECDAFLLNNNGEWVKQFTFAPSWETYCIDLDDHTGDEVYICLSGSFRPTNDSRELGVCIRKALLLMEDDKEESNRLFNRQKNFELNEREYRSGKLILDSTPPLLAISIAEICQIAAKRPCTYCSWEGVTPMKERGVRFSLNLFKYLKTYFDNAIKVTDCSIGEPLLNKNFLDVVHEITKRGANFTFTSNGQLFSKNKIDAVLDKNVNITFSLDAATSETYSKYRHSGFEKVIENIKTLCKLKKERNNFPHITCAFIIMNSNKHEIPAYIEMLAGFGVDCIVFSELFVSEEFKKNFVRISESGYIFDYMKEIVPDEELQMLQKSALELGKKYNIPILINSTNFLENTQKQTEDKDKILPLCSEPWKAAYLMGHEICACCFSAGSQSWDCKEEDMERRFKEIFNGKVFQEIRSALAQGTLSHHCLSRSSCPHVKKFKKKNSIAMN